MKRFLSILAALCLMFAMAVPAFAADINYPVLDNNRKHSLIRNVGGTLFLYFFDDFSVTDSEFVIHGSDDYRYDDGVWTFLTSKTTKSSCSLTDDVVYDTTETFVINNPIQWASCDGSCPFTDVNGDNVCDVCGGFFTPPPPGPLVEVMTTLKEQDQLSQVLTQVVTMIPIGLACWVGYRGFRKALALLQKILHQA